MQRINTRKKQIKSKDTCMVMKLLFIYTIPFESLSRNMTKIRVLDAEVVKRISAGEVKTSLHICLNILLITLALFLFVDAAKTR